MNSSPFDDLSSVYQALVDWPRRLDRETPFFRELLASINAHRVVDVACGTGHHADLFHRWGLQVEGADVSPQMIRQARANFGESTRLKWVVRSFDDSTNDSPPCDVAICVGNSLALADDMSTVHRAVGQMMSRVRSGGAIVIQVLNLWKLPDGPIVWQKCVQRELNNAAHLIIKGVHRCGDRGYVDLVVTDLDGALRYKSESVAFLGLCAEDLVRTARMTGATRVEVLGGYHGEPYERPTSTDLILLARK